MIKLNKNGKNLQEMLGISHEELDQYANEFMEMKKAGLSIAEKLEYAFGLKDKKKMLFFILTIGIEIGADTTTEILSDVLSEEQIIDLMLSLVMRIHGTGFSKN